jgi:Transposase DNA-binding/Transposase DDE domain
VIDIRDEFVDAPLKDKRLQERLEDIGPAIAADPSASFPNIMASEGDLEALYRFVNNPRIEAAAILQPHVAATAARLAERTVAVVHDTTDFVFSGVSGESLGYIPTTAQRGFLGHFALAVGDDGDVLGVLGIETLFFEKRIRGVIRKNRSKVSYAKNKDRASLRWDRGVERARNLIPKSASAIHVMDCEADNYRLFDAMIAAGDRFVIRVRHDRRGARTDESQPWEQLSDVAERATHVCEREVPLSKRKRVPGLNATYGPRDARVARLSISSTRIIIKRPGKWYVGAPPQLCLNLVSVRELNPPRDTEPVEWLLLTTEPVENQPDTEAVVDWYRRRWVIEELFRALKTGCAYEQRQFESRDALLRTLSLLVPIAWQLLALRDLARRQPRQPARKVLRETQLQVLRALTKNKLSKSPSAEEALLAIAAQGGHLKRNGAPGWQTLERGLEKLWWAEFGYRAAVEDMTK